MELADSAVVRGNRTLKKYLAQLAGAVEYTDCISAKGLPPFPTSLLDMTLNNLMVRFQ